MNDLFTSHEEAREERAAIMADSGMSAVERFVVRQICWWFGCAPHPQDTAPPDELECMHCGMNVPYSDMVGDTRHNRTIGWLRYWLWRRWIPAKCYACGARFGHRENCDGVPF